MNTSVSGTASRKVKRKTAVKNDRTSRSRPSRTSGARKSVLIGKSSDRRPTKPTTSAPTSSRGRSGRRRYPIWWQDALTHLSERDPRMAQLTTTYAHSRLRGSSSPYSTLANAIIGQQISVKAGNAIRARIEAHSPLDSQSIAAMSVDRLRTCGLSRSKASYILGLAEWFNSQRINSAWFSHRSTEQIREQLLAQRGIGEWSFQMFAIFYLMESDVMPRADVGLWQGIEKLYLIPRHQLDRKITKLMRLWSPYCTAAVWFIWRSRDVREVHY